MRIIGCIYNSSLKNRIIGIKTKYRILYLHFPNNQFSQLKRYLYPGTYVDVDFDEEKFYIRRGIAAYTINFVQQIYRFYGTKKVQYYDYKELNSSLSDFLNSLGNIMFLDLEMTMPTYSYSGKGYRSEIVQVGYLLVNGMDDEITRYNQYILPKLHGDISKRTLNFLKISADTFHKNAIPYPMFYEDFKMIIQQYHPSIVIFGKNDRLTLNESFLIHHVESLASQIRYVNLSKLIQSYYHLTNEPGLFKLYQTYYDNDSVQVHDAFDDSYVTMAVFKAFKADVEHRTNFFSKIKEKF